MADSRTVAAAVRVLLADLVHHHDDRDVVLGAAFAAITGELVAHAEPGRAAAHLRATASVLDLAEGSVGRTAAVPDQPSPSGKMVPPGR